MACEFPVVVKAKLMLTAIHCLLTYFTLLVEKYVQVVAGVKTSTVGPEQRLSTLDTVRTQLTNTRRTRHVTRQTLSLSQSVHGRG